MNNLETLNRDIESVEGMITHLQEELDRITQTLEVLQETLRQLNNERNDLEASIELSEELLAVEDELSSHDYYDNLTEEEYENLMNRLEI